MIIKLKCSFFFVVETSTKSVRFTFNTNHFCRIIAEAFHSIFERKPIDGAIRKVHKLRNPTDDYLRFIIFIII